MHKPSHIYSALILAGNAIQKPSLVLLYKKTVIDILWQDNKCVNETVISLHSK